MGTASAIMNEWTWTLRSAAAADYKVRPAAAVC